MLFVSRNYADVTMTDIAEAAEVTKGALYHHFGSKDELYLTMMHEYLVEQKERIRAAVESGGTCRERLRRLTLSFVQLPPGQYNLMRLVRRDVNVFKNPEREQLIHAYQAALPDQVEAILRDGIRDGEVVDFDPRLLAWQHVAMVEVVLSDYAKRTLGSPERMADFVTELFFDGVGT